MTPDEMVRSICREMALGMDIGWNKSYMQVVNGIEGEVLLDKWNYTNKARPGLRHPETQR